MSNIQRGGLPIGGMPLGGMAGRRRVGVVDADAYRAAVMADSPFAFWRLGESSGTVAADETGTYPATYVGSPTLGAVGPFIGALAPDLNGTNQYMSVSIPTDPTQYTLEGWVYYSGNDGNVIVRTAATGPLDKFSHQILIRDGKPNAYTYDGRGRYVIGSAIATGWHHLVATAKNGGQMKLYVDGLSVGNPVSISTLWTGGDRYRIGQASRVVGYWTGRMSHIAVYHHELSADRVAAHYAAAGL